MSIVQFSFESSSIRTLGDAISPLFVAADVAAILGYGSTKDATRILDDDEKQTVSIDTNGGKQSMTAVTESGLYAMIFKSKRPEAKRFRKWVTSEVLPAIRKTGRYEAQTTITPAEQRAIQREVAIRAHKTSSNYRTIYRAIKARYQIARYDQLPRTQLEDCLDFIREVELDVPEVPHTTKHRPRSRPPNSAPFSAKSPSVRIRPHRTIGRSTEPSRHATRSPATTSCRALS